MPISSQSIKVRVRGADAPTVRGLMVLCTVDSQHALLLTNADNQGSRSRAAHASDILPERLQQNAIR